MESLIFLNFLRIRQWYKNIIIFLPLIFAPNFLSVENIILITLGFFSLCLVLSASYVRNDINDIEADKIHPKKKLRALPSGLITTKQAYLMYIALIVTGFSLSFSLSVYFGILMVLLYGITEIYSKWLKNIIILDVFMIGLNFIIRSVLGIILLQSTISPWIIMGVFFVALMLGFMKRQGELRSLGEDAGRHRKTLQEYTKSSLNSMLIISAMLILTTYSFYSLEGPHGDWRLILTVPIVVFVILRQLHLSSINSPIIQENEILKDKSSTFGLLVYIIITFYLIYLAPSHWFLGI